MIFFQFEQVDQFCNYLLETHAHVELVSVIILLLSSISSIQRIDL